MARPPVPPPTPPRPSRSPLSRRQCLTHLGGAASGLLLWGLRPLSAWAQHCSEPLPDGPTVEFKPDPDLPLRERKSVYDLTPAESERLRAAYQALRDLGRRDPKDPRGWLLQAETHCRFCGGFAGEIHRTWFFLPWHRAFLYFHERILGALLGDPSFALPYWDWDDERRRKLPPPYVEPASADNPLWDAKRHGRLDGGVPRAEVGTNALRRIVAAKDFGGFGGNAMKPGLLEIGPHNIVHYWIGRNQPDMGQFATAARDPVFYPHHAQIDRLWHQWQQGGRGHPEDPSWLDQRWTFVDERKQLVSIRVRDVLESEPQLRYHYRPTAPLSAPVKRSAPRPPSPQPECPSLGVQMPGPLRLHRGQPVTVPLPLPTDCHLVALRFERITLPLDESILVRLFIHLPTARADTDIDQVAPHVLGYFCLAAHFGRDMPHPHPPRPFDLDLPIPEAMEPLLAQHDRRQPALLTLVPVMYEDTPPLRAALRIERLSWMATAKRV